MDYIDNTNCSNKHYPKPCCKHCSQDCRHPCCCPGPKGDTGPIGPTGPQGPASGILDFSDFFALMPPDNAATIAVGTDVSFPQNGPSSRTSIIRISDNTFTLSSIGIYQVLFQISVDEPGQLVLT